MPARSLPVFVALHFVDARVIASNCESPRVSAPAEAPPVTFGSAGLGLQSGPTTLASQS